MANTEYIMKSAPRIIKWDRNLKQDETYWSVERSLLNSVSSEIDLKSLGPAFPTDPELSKLSRAAYREVEEQNNVEEQDRIPAGWEFITAAWNKDNAYFGAVYFNQANQQVVVAHRGTESWGAIKTDVKAVLRNKYHSHVDSAVTFAYQITEIVNSLNKKDGAYLKLSFTGHSLGGWLAQITAFSTEYLKLYRGEFIMNKSVHDGYHAHTVTFDSPGCRPMIHKLIDDLCFRYADKSIINLHLLDITNYLSAPNLVNSCNKHIGTLIRLFVSFEDYCAFYLNLKNLLYKVFGFGYTYYAHSIKNIVEFLENPHNERDNMLMVHKILDWPYTKGRHFKGLSYLRNRREYTKVIKILKLHKDYHVNIGIDFPRKDFRYKTCELDLSLIRENNFSSKEYDFLFWYQTQQYDDVIFANDAEENQWALKEIKKKLNSAEPIEITDCGIKFSNDPQDCLKSIKWLLHFFPDLVLPRKGSYDYMTKIKLKIYKKTSENYVKPFIENQLDFQTNLFQLKDKLNDKHKRIFILREELTSAGVLKIYKIFERIKFETEYKENVLFLGISEISTLQLESTFRDLSDHPFLMVIECNLGVDEVSCAKTKAILNELSKILEVKKKIKLILVVNKCCTINLRKHFLQFNVISHSGIKFSDLNVESKKPMLLKEISLQGKSICLAQLIFSLQDLSDARNVTNEDYYKMAVEEVLKNSKHDVFVFRNITLEDLQIKISYKHKVVTHKKLEESDNARFIVLDQSKDDDKCNIYNHFRHNGKIHWLKYENNHFILTNSKADFEGDNDEFTKNVFLTYFKNKQLALDESHEQLLNALLSTETIMQIGNGEVLSVGTSLIALGKDEKHLYVERTLVKGELNISERCCRGITQIAEKVVVVDGGSGMGKSLLFTQLASVMKEADHSLWVIKINLTGLCPHLNTVHLDDDQTNVTDFLMNAIELKTHFEKTIFRHYLDNCKIVFLFDGLDQLNTKCGQVFIQLIKKLNDHLHPKQIWMSSRPSALQKMEVGNEVYKIKGFGKDEQVEFISKYAKYFNCADKINKLSDFIHSFSNLELDELPLFFKLASDFIRYEGFRSEIDFKELHFNLVTLYEMFMWSKTFVNDPMQNDALSIHKLISVWHICGRDSIIDFYNELVEITKELNDLEDTCVRTGIITQVVDGVPRFIHDTFAEYLATCHLIEQINVRNDAEIFFKILYDNLLVNDRKISFLVCEAKCTDKLIQEFTQSNVYKNQLLISFSKFGCVKLLQIFANDPLLNLEIKELLHNSIKYAQINVLQFLLENYSQEANLELFSQHILNDELWRLAVGTNNVEIVKMLLESLNKHFPGEFLSLDELIQVLQISISKNNVLITELLLPYGDKISFEGLMTACYLIDSESMVSFIMVYVSEHFNSQIRELLAQKFEYGNTLLHLAARNFNREMVKQILELGAQLGIQNDEDQYPLCLAIKNERIEIVELILDEDPPLDIVKNSTQFADNQQILNLIWLYFQRINSDADQD